ncbi:hypothetical protein ABIF81_001354 [Bradyrhizobium daqingense]
MRTACPLVERHAADLADHRAAPAADRLDVDRLRRVEHQPDSVTAAERRRRRRDLKRKRHPQAVAVAACIDAGNRGLRRGGDFGGCFGRFLDRVLGSLFQGLLGRFGHCRLDWRDLRNGWRRLWRFLRCFYRLRGLRCRRRNRLRCFGRRFHLHARLDVDLGLARDRLRCRRRDLTLRGRRPFRRGRRHSCATARLELRDRRLGRCGRLASVRLEGDVDDVVLLVTERVHVGIADQRDLDAGLVDVGLLLDRGDVRRCCDDRVGQIEIEVGVEGERELLLVEHGGDADAIGHLEHEAHEGRLHRGADADLRTLLGLGRGALGAQGPFGHARALGELLDDVHRQGRRRPLPPLRQKVDEGALARIHGVDGDAPRQRQANGAAVGIAPC